MSTPTVADHAPAFFRADVARLNEVLAPHRITDPIDGWLGFNPATAPTGALHVYSELIGYGYAQGWIE